MAYRCHSIPSCIGGNQKTRACVNANMADAWKKYKQTIANKRLGNKKNSPSTDILKKEEIIVQRLSAEVSGKAQKYSRIGPREFVPYEYDEVSVSNIKEACMKHFATTIGDNIVCDILAGEQGPSCTSVEHIPDLRVVHIRFVEDKSASVHEIRNRRAPKRKHSPSEAASTVKSLPCSRQPSPSKAYPKSLSVIDMLKLGKVIDDKIGTEPIELFTFNINEMAWSSNSTTVEFSIEKEPFGVGGFREAFKARTKARGFANCLWVVKKYLKSTEATIDQTNQTVEQHSRKVVQMHMLAKNIASKLEQHVEKEDLKDMYGETLKFKKVYLGKMQDNKWVTVEEFIEGTFTKYLNNNGMLCGDGSTIEEKCENLAHFSYEHSNNELIIVDMQGSGYSLFDPEIATKNLQDGDEILFSTGNLSTVAITNFTENHICNDFCSLLGLKKL